MSNFKFENIKIDNSSDNNDLLNEMLNNKVFVDELYTYHIDENDIKNNFIELSDYYEEFLKKQNNTFDGYYERKLIFEDGKVSFEYGISKKYRTISLVKGLSIICDIPDEYLLKEFDDIELNKQRTNFLKEFSFAANDVKGKPFNFFIYSKKRSGGTYVSSILYKEFLLKHHCSGSFVNFNNLYRKLDTIKFDDKITFNKILNDLIEPELLVLNKASNIDYKKYSRDNILYTILDQRATNKKSTIIISEVSYDDFLKLLVVNGDYKDIKYKMLKELLDEEYKKHDISIKLNYY